MNKENIQYNRPFDYYSARFDESWNDIHRKWASDGLTDEEVQEREKHFVDRYCDNIVENEINYYSSHMYSMSEKQSNDLNEFLTHHNQLWGECFILSETLYEIVADVYEMYRTYVNNHIHAEEKTAKHNTYIALSYIHVRCCQIYLEFLCLLKHGFADGAFARWRSMYELYCFALFIVKYGDHVAKKYIKQATKNEWDKLEWTTEVKNKNNKKLINSLNDIFNNCGIEEQWKNEYDSSCFAVHASPQGTFGRIGASYATDVLPAGHSDSGIVIAGQHSAIFLDRISTLLLDIYHASDDAKIYTKIINTWTGKVCAAYNEVDSKHFEKHSV